MYKDSFLWCEKYRPDKLRDIILPEKSKKIIRSYIKSKDLPHLLFHTKFPGTGKTTLAKTIASELQTDFIFINGSKDGGIDNLRNVIERFACTVSFSGLKKIAIIDEADHISSKFSDAMRGVLEAFHKSCAFIFTCNNLHKIIEPIISRVQVIDFNYKNKKELYEAKIKIFKRLEYILKDNNIEYINEALIEIITKKFPDIRSMINLIQMYSQIDGKIDNGIIDQLGDFDVSELFRILKEKKFATMRKFVADHSINNIDIYRLLFNNLDLYLEKESVGQAILLIADYQSRYGGDPEIYVVALLTELMLTCKYL